MGLDTGNPVAAYKRLLAELLERRPSGTRQRLASAMGKNRSFVSQITNPAYAIPVPAAHLDLIFELCHFSPGEKQQFLSAYERAHPRRAASPADRSPRLSVELPDLGDETRNRRLQALVADFVTQFASLARDTDVKGRHP